MSSFFQGRALRAMAVMAVLTGGGVACADTRNDRVADSGVRYVYRGQSAVVIPEPARDEAPYALTGNRDTVRDQYWNEQGHWMNAGQARVFVPPTR